MERTWSKSCTVRSRVIALALVAAFGPAGWVGCGEGDVPIDEACRSTVDALCDAAARCGEAPADIDLCRKVYGVSHLKQCNNAVDLVKLGEVEYDGREVFKCLELAEKVECGALRGDTLKPCFTYGVSGTKENGEECRYGERYGCKAGLACQIVGMAAACAPLPKFGETCSRSCATGYVCNGQTRRCEAKAESGECCKDKPCRDGLRCDRKAGVVCVVYSKEDEACEFVGHTTTCGVGLTCVEKVCKRKSDVGQSCAGGQLCLIGLVCDPYSRTCKSPKDMQ